MIALVVSLILIRVSIAILMSMTDRFRCTFHVSDPRFGGRGIVVIDLTKVPKRLQSFLRVFSPYAVNRTTVAANALEFGLQSKHDFLTAAFQRNCCRLL